MDVDEAAAVGGGGTSAPAATSSTEEEAGRGQGAVVADRGGVIGTASTGANVVDKSLQNNSAVVDNGGVIGTAATGVQVVDKGFHQDSAFVNGGGVGATAATSATMEKAGLGQGSVSSEGENSGNRAEGAAGGDEGSIPWSSPSSMVESATETAANLFCGSQGSGSATPPGAPCPPPFAGVVGTPTSTAPANSSASSVAGPPRTAPTGAISPRRSEWTGASATPMVPTMAPSPAPPSTSPAVTPAAPPEDSPIAPRAARPADTHPRVTDADRSGDSGRAEKMKMEGLMSHFKCTWWASSKSPIAQMSVAPAGTAPNPVGSASVFVFRSAWVQMVEVTLIKDDLAVGSFSSTNLYKMADIGDHVSLSNNSHLRKKSLHVVLALLMLVCAREPQFINILLEMISSPITGMLPTGRSEIVGGIVQVGRRPRPGSDNPDSPAGASQDNRAGGAEPSEGDGAVADGEGGAVPAGNFPAEEEANCGAMPARAADAGTMGSGGIDAAAMDGGGDDAATDGRAAAAGGNMDVTGATNQSGEAAGAGPEVEADSDAGGMAPVGHASAAEEGPGPAGPERGGLSNMATAPASGAPSTFRTALGAPDITAGWTPVMEAAYYFQNTPVAALARRSGLAKRRMLRIQRARHRPAPRGGHVVREYNASL